ncbi:alpha/beta fold hydrolase [Streptomyces sp. NPDC051162]|uniref:thioesterase II family protein n=1 Tax=unclassified Streptomyces TaxID=2593676 RepID=UPI00342A530F
MDGIEESGRLWLRRFHSSPDGPDSDVTVVCFPHAGGSASYFLRLSAALSARAEVVALQYPGRQDRRSEPPLSSVDALVRGITRALRGRGDRPMVFFGHSMGGTLAFETARRLEAESDGRLLGLIVSGREAPGPARRPTTRLRDDAGLLAGIRELEGTASALLDDEDVVRMIMPALRADYTAVETYAYRKGPALSCPLVVYTGDTDPQVSGREAERWAEHTDSDFRIRTFAGGHFYLDEQREKVTAALTEDLTAFGARLRPAARG